MMNLTKEDYEIICIGVAILLIVLSSVYWLIWKFGPHIDEEALKKNVP